MLPLRRLSCCLPGWSPRRCPATTPVTATMCVHLPCGTLLHGLPLYRVLPHLFAAVTTPTAAARLAPPLPRTTAPLPTLPIPLLLRSTCEYGPIMLAGIPTAHYYPVLPWVRRTPTTTPARHPPLRDGCLLPGGVPGLAGTPLSPPPVRSLRGVPATTPVTATMCVHPPHHLPDGGPTTITMSFAPVVRHCSLVGLRRPCPLLLLPPLA